MDLESLGQGILDAALDALGAGAKLVEQRAKARAPVRNIFGREYEFRAKTTSELKADLRFVNTATLESMTQTGLMDFATTVDWQSYRTVGTMRMQRDWHERRSGAARQHLADYDAEMSVRTFGGPSEETFLTRRGAYEVRTQRANYATWGHTHVGGRLRGEIKATGVAPSGDGGEAWVISPTPYAKFMEFGTRHNRAHPYLRPALQESRGEVVSAIADAVKVASQKGAGSMEVEIVVRL